VIVMSKTDQGNDGTVGSSREALLKAATLLFAEQGPAAVSTRKIASEARVNNGLIHRHFRTKDALLREVLDSLAMEISEATQDGGERSDIGALLRFFDAAHESSMYWKLLARCILDGQSPEELQSAFPTMERIVAAIGELQEADAIDRDADTRTLAAAFTAMGLGWLVFEPWLVRATGLSDRPLDQTRRDVRRLARTLIRKRDS
jgi:AcrR family transcriptional regulator